MRAALLVALLAAQPARVTPAAGGSSGPSGSPWTVVQADGSRVVFAVPPENRGGRLVGKLEGSGTLVSIPAARVDAEATARANAPGTPAATPFARPVPTPMPFATPPLGSQVKLKKTAEEAQKVLEGARTGSPAPVRSPAPSPGSRPADDAAGEPALVESEPVDRQGRGEEFWRERAGAARAEIEQAERDLAVAEADLEAAERAYLGPGEGERNSFAIRVYEARDRTERARRDLRLATGRLEALEEEARRAGAFPGWLR